MKTKNLDYRRSIKYGILAILLATISIGCEKEVVLTEKQDSDKTTSLEHKATGIHTTMKLFNGGAYNEHSFRIPSIVQAPNGNLVAFAECRRKSGSDFGDINLVYKIYNNTTKTWGGLKQLVGVGDGTWGNPTAVTDFITGRIWVFYNWNSGDITSMDQIEHGDRKTYYSYSDNNGETFVGKTDMTVNLLPPGLKWDAVGPGIGIQTTKANAGRLIIPATGRNFYSDDHGKTWKYVKIPGGTGEATIVELSDGNLWRNDRPTKGTWERTDIPNAKRRWCSKSTNKDLLAFATFAPKNTLLDPRCEASIVRYTLGTPYRIYFLNPATTDDENRCKMTVRISYDDGATWPISRRIDTNDCSNGVGGYSSMTRTANSSVGALIEMQESTGNWSIQFHEFNLPWILNDGETEEPIL